MKTSKLKFSEYMQNISRFKSFGKFVLIVYYRQSDGFLPKPWAPHAKQLIFQPIHQ